LAPYAVKDVEETLGVNDRYQLSVAAKIFQRRINKALMISGVSIEDPDSTYIAPGVKVGQDTVIRPGTFLMGNTVIGEGNVIGPNCYFENVVVGNITKSSIRTWSIPRLAITTTLGPISAPAKRHHQRQSPHRQLQRT
jgi:bifunctional UDP-N-acetylglucosamine pyrophosphorylase/glucosamine-1-phosphate N-acetyltransferase